MTEQIRHRRTVDQAGFARLCHLVTLDLELSDGAVRLYLLLLMYARQAGKCWPGRARLAGDLGKSTETIDRRLAELVERGLVSRTQRRDRTALTWLEDLEAIYTSVPVKNDKDKNPVPVKNDKDMSLSKMTRKEETEEETNNSVVGGNNKNKDTTKTKQTTDALSAFGVSQTVAERIAEKSTAADVDGWLEYAGAANGLHDRVAFVVRRLLDGEEPPEVAEPADDRQRYTGGRYGEFIQH